MKPVSSLMYLTSLDKNSGVTYSSVMSMILYHSYAYNYNIIAIGHHSIDSILRIKATQTLQC